MKKRYKKSMADSKILSCLFAVVCCLMSISVHASTLNKKIIVHVAKNDSAGLKQALETSSSGSVVILDGGTYVGNFVANKTFTLESNNNAVLTSNGKGSVLTVTAPNFYVHNLRFRDSGTNISNHDSCIYLTKKASGSKVKHARFAQCEFAVWVNAVNNVEISNNDITGTTQEIVSDRGNSIYLFYTKGTVVENNHISLGRDGIYISNSTNVLIKDNEANNVRFGIHYMYSDSCSLIGNKTTNSRIGAALMYSKHLKVHDNVFKNNSVHGLLLRQILYSDIVNNISDNNADGIFLGGSYFNTIRDNKFIGNIIGVQITSGSTNNKIYNNDFISNRLQAKYLGMQSLYWGYKGRGNYWSGYKSFDQDHNGVGDTAYYVTNLGDWLVFSFPILRVVMDSPGMVLLKKIENEFPVVRRAALIDKYPLVRPV